jgi:hypothetical protein
MYEKDPLRRAASGLRLRKQWAQEGSSRRGSHTREKRTPPDAEDFLSHVKDLG